MTRKRKSRCPIRFSARVHFDIIKAARNLYEWVQDYAKSIDVSGPVEWNDVPIGALVTGTSRGVEWLLVRATVDSGALVGTIEGGKACCHPDYEHQPWSALMRRNGSLFLRVLAKGVKPTATAAQIEALAERAFKKMKERGDATT